jgi:hypothetical protein
VFPDIAIGPSDFLPFNEYVGHPLQLMNIILISRRENLLDYQNINNINQIFGKISQVTPSTKQRIEGLNVMIKNG